MKCPYCGQEDTRVLDSRPVDDNTSIRRRRECIACNNRFTTYERQETLPLQVVKKDGSRQVFDRLKIINGVLKACEKRPVAIEKVEEIAVEIETEIRNVYDREVSSALVGEKVMEHLKNMDEVAYVRFASVYNEFKDLDNFIKEIDKIRNDKRGK